MRLAKPLIFIGIIFGIIGAGYTYHVAKSVEYQFNRSLKWDIPSKIYSDAAYYYPGLEVDINKFRAKLARLEYRDTGKKIYGPGDYSIRPDAIEIYLHDFDYPMQEFKGFPVKLTLENNIITSIIRTDDSSLMPSLKLEPELISKLFGASMEDRTLVTFDEVPDALKNAVILIEDERFYKHRGIDPIAILRAAVKDILSLKIVEGGSTLTQQLVKNYFLTSKRSFIRKIQEALLALMLETKHTKEEILEAYLNEIYLGQRGVSSVSGVGEAARLYFGKNVDQLTIGECALLAGMIKTPNRFNPFTQKDSAMERRNFVLKRMFDKNIITKDEFEAAIREPIITPERTIRINMAPYFIDFVKMQLAELYSEDILTKQGLKIFTTLDMTHQLIAESVIKEEVVKLEKDYTSMLPKSRKGDLEAALVSIQPQTGYIRAMVGGRGYEKTQLNRITQALRQPGSTFKPFVYLTAFDPKRTERFYAPASIISDTSFSVVAGGQRWSPTNYDKKEHGDISLRSALMNSYNIATAKLALSIGLDAIVKTARDAGITSELMAVPSIALGSFEVTPLEMAAAYTIFPNSGILAKPISIINVVTRDGDVLEKKHIEMKRVFDAGPAWLVTSILKDVIDKGTGTGVRRLGFTGIAAGKTGTTNDYKDAWFVGFTPDYLALVWVGYDDNTPTNMSGAMGALPIWVSFMKEAVKNSQKDFPSPEGIILVKIDPSTGLLASPRCGEAVFETFIEGTEPDESCTTVNPKR